MFFCWTEIMGIPCQRPQSFITYALAQTEMENIYMNKVIKLLFCWIILLSAPLLANNNRFNNVYLGHCSNFGQGVGLSFSSCANSNFSSIGRELGSFNSYCINVGEEVSYSFLSCMQSNFRSVESRSNGALYLQYCSNFDRRALNFSYVNCVNNNFRAIQRFINNQ